jgi:hypothetical protein
MKNLVLVLVACLGLAGCVAEEGMYVEAPVAVASGSVEFCDDWGCRMIDAPYYYDDGDVIYWDAHFGVWIGPHGYWHGGIWHRGWVDGYHGWYGVHHYHYFHEHTGGWRFGSGWHGYRGRHR